MALRLFLHPPAGIMEARVNEPGGVTYPLDEVSMDNVSDNTDPGGDWQFVREGMTVFFYDANDGSVKGIQRVRKNATSDTLYIGRSSQGERHGEVNIEDNDIIIVYNDFRPWALTPYIDPGPPPVIYKDSELEVSDRVSDPPPVSNAGVPAIGDIDAGGTDALRVQLPHETNTSFAVKDGESISTHTWELPDPSVYVSGGGGLYDTNKVDGTPIVVDTPEGLRWYSQLVTDSNGKQHRAWVPLVGLNPDGSTFGDIEDFEIVSWDITPSGQRVSIRVLSDILPEFYPDGTLVILFDGNPSSPDDRSNVLFWGWHMNDPQTINSQRTGLTRDVVLECADIGGWLEILPGFPFIVGGDSNLFDDWAYMPDAEWRHLLTYTLKWHSNALDIADWQPSTQLANYDFLVRQTAKGNLYQQVHGNAQDVCPDFHFTVSRKGQMLVRVDPLLQLPANRTEETQVTLSEDNWKSIRVTGQHWPRFHWLREEAILARKAEDSLELVAMRSIAPGESPGQGQGEAPKREHLAQSQNELNVTTGQRYGRHNAPETFYQITLWSESDGGIEPATMRWVRVTIPEAYAAQRGLHFTNARGLVHRLTKTFRYTRTGVVIENTIVWERETEGIPGATWTPPETS